MLGGQRCAFELPRLTQEFPDSDMPVYLLLYASKHFLRRQGRAYCLILVTALATPQEHSVGESCSLPSLQHAHY